jgi:hypothetical protein
MDTTHTHRRERDNREEGYSEATPRIITVRRSLPSAADRELAGICCAGSHRVRILYAVARRVKRGEICRAAPAAVGVCACLLPVSGELHDVESWNGTATDARAITIGGRRPFACKVWFDATALPCAQGCMRERHNNTRCQRAVQGGIQRGETDPVPEERNVFARVSRWRE